MRVDEGGHGQPRPVAAGAGQLAEEFDDLLGEDAVAHHAAVGLRRAVRLAADPAREAVGIEAVGPLVGRHRGGNGRARLVGRHQSLVGAGDHQVGVRNVPLAPVVRLVAAGAEPVAERRHRVGIEPLHVRVVGLLGQAVGVGPAVQRGVLAREERRPAGQAGRRAGVVPVEFEAAVADGLARAELLPAEAGQGLVLVRGWVALLVGHDHKDVGWRHRGRLHAHSSRHGGGPAGSVVALHQLGGPARLADVVARRLELAHVGLDVEHRRTVDGVETPHLQVEAIDPRSAGRSRRPAGSGASWPAGRTCPPRATPGCPRGRRAPVSHVGRVDEVELEDHHQVGERSPGRPPRRARTARRRGG